MRAHERGPGMRPRRSRRRIVALEQLTFDLGPERPRWRLSRLVVRSPYRDRILERVEFVRHFFEELDGDTIRLGLAQKRGILGWGSLDPAQPGIWVRPKRLDYFTIAHELTHLLQARSLVPRGERQCDLWAVARSPHVIDALPGYLKLPRALRGRRGVSPADAAFLCEAARDTLAAREAGERRYLARFERVVAEAFRTGRLGAAETPERAAVTSHATLSLEPA